MNGIDPKEIGRLEEQVHQLQLNQQEMEKDIKELLALANKSKGGLWMGMAIVSFISSLMTVIIKGWFHN